ncbi:response regulator transcription factor [Thermoactinospora rubra]|uniref:response regulator transcription factor n=1 Tax=Thermoactinospora rubra TaxID=1088767 RepID=UPI000A110AF2|nr:response regulator transcription factor [Thermoactinospora rubra]
MIRTLLAEDMDLVRGALVALLAYEEDIEIVAEVDRGDRVLAAAQASRPDVAVVDLAMPGQDGLEVARELHEELPACGVLILTGVGTPGALKRALEVNVRGFLAKDAPPAQLADAIRKIADGGRVVDSSLAIAAMTGPEAPLTPRELDVLGAAAEGSSIEEIARSLFLARGTVRNYLSRTRTKLGARSRIDAIRIAREAGWI